LINKTREEWEKEIDKIIKKHDIKITDARKEQLINKAIKKFEYNLNQLQQNRKKKNLNLKKNDNIKVQKIPILKKSTTPNLKSKKIRKKQVHVKRNHKHSRNTNLFKDPKVHFQLRKRIQNNKYIDIRSIKIQKNEYLKNKGVNCKYDEIDITYTYIKKLEEVGITKKIKNRNDAELEWINVLLSVKRIPRTESLREAKILKNCMDHKVELAKIMHETYQEISKKFSCDELEYQIKLKKLEYLKLDPKKKKETEEEQIEKKLERASRNLTENNP
jgi:hypothetical protein